MEYIANVEKATYRKSMLHACKYPVEDVVGSAIIGINY